MAGNAQELKTLPKGRFQGKILLALAEIRTRWVLRENGDCKQYFIT